MNLETVLNQTQTFFKQLKPPESARYHYCLIKYAILEKSNELKLRKWNLQTKNEFGDSSKFRPNIFLNGRNHLDLLEFNIFYRNMQQYKIVMSQSRKTNLETKNNLETS